MDLYLLNKQFEMVDVVEGYNSAIWTERYDEYGDCEIQYSVGKKKKSDFPEDFYLMRPDTNELMIIDTSEVEYVPDAGRVLSVKSRSLSWILDRRIVWAQTDLNMMLEAAVKRLLDQNIIASSTTNRNITNLKFKYAGTSVPSIYNVEAQYRGQRLYTVIRDLCQTHDIGFRITSENLGTFDFQLYGGVNRSYDQDALSHVVFSPEYDNIGKIRYVRSKVDYRNVVLVGGDGDGKDKKTFSLSRTATFASGMNRYEGWHDSNISSKRENANGDQVDIPKSEYDNLLRQAGREYLKDNDISHVFDGETDPNNTTGYGVDFHLGDIVQVDDEDTVTSPARVVEYIVAEDASSGSTAYPGLRIKEEE